MRFNSQLLIITRQLSVMYYGIYTFLPITIPPFHSFLINSFKLRMSFTCKNDKQRVEEDNKKSITLTDRGIFGVLVVLDPVGI